MPVSTDYSLPVIRSGEYLLDTIGPPRFQSDPLPSQTVRYRRQPLPAAPVSERSDVSEKGGTYTVHRDMSGLKSDVLGHNVDLFV